MDSLEVMKYSKSRATGRQKLKAKVPCTNKHASAFSCRGKAGFKAVGDLNEALLIYKQIQLFKFFPCAEIPEDQELLKIMLQKALSELQDELNSGSMAHLSTATE